MSDILGICYHAVSDRWPSSMALTEAALSAQLAYLADRGYRGATITDAVRSRPRGKTVVITFDDAYRSVFELAAPILRRFGFPGTLFVPTAFPATCQPMRWPGVDRWLGTPHESELIPASWEEIGALADSGWEIGSHTRTHPRLTQIDDEHLAEELEGSRSDCERALGRPCTSLAYPHGDEDERVVRACARAGYTVGATAPTPYYAPRPLRWPRVGVHRQDDLAKFRSKVSRTRRILRKDPLWTIYQAGRRLRARS
jgi:peptidoglycan/xylan/chitin deacetylase (PgdA/CDA1 family)